MIWTWQSQTCNITYGSQHMTLLSPIPIHNRRICQNVQHSIPQSCRIPHICLTWNPSRHHLCCPNSHIFLSNLDLLIGKPSSTFFVIWRVPKTSGFHMAEREEASLATLTLTETWPKITMQSWGMLFYFMVALFRGLLNSRKLFHYLQPRVNMWQLPMQLKKPSGFALSFHNSSNQFRANHTIFWQPVSHSAHKRSPVPCMHQAYWHPLPLHPLDHWKWVITTRLMLANTLTKALPSPKVKHFTAKLGLILIWGGVLEFWHANATWASITTHCHSTCMYLPLIVYLLSTKTMVHSTLLHIYFPTSNALVFLLSIVLY